MKFLWTFTLLFCFNFSVLAQLDSIHYMPPMHARVDWGPQFLYLTTPEVNPFRVTITSGTGTVIGNAIISNTQPYTFSIGNTNDTYTLVTEANLHKALREKGIVIEGGKKFYAYFRTHSNNNAQASDLTCKGRAAIGKTFRIGHLLQEANASSRANFIGVLATEDSTVVTLSGYNNSTLFRRNSTDATSTGTETVTLQKGESVVFGQYLGSNATSQPPNGLMGALLSATKPIAVNVGSWCGSPATSGDKDVGIDQIVPVENVGKEYILNRGNGSNVLERPMIVAHFDNTQIWVNGAASPIAILNAGQFLALPATSYTVNNNLHIKASRPIYVYQMIGGAPAGDANELRTEGLIFVPPISCTIPNKIDNIFEPNAINTMLFNGGVMITAMKDSAVNVFINGTQVALGAPQPVQGNTGFVTYRNLTLFSSSTRVQTISVVAQGAVQVAMYGQNSAASFAAFYSGFSKTVEPNITLRNIGDGTCPDTLVTTGLYDGVQWIYEDSIIKYGKDTFLIINAPGRYIAQGYLGICRQSETAEDTLDISFVSPDFPYTTAQPSCWGYTDGKITFGNVTGGYPPYQYSITNGQVFSRNPVFANIKAGAYKLVARDSLGCYNRPLSITVGEPAKLTVDITETTVYAEPVKVGQQVKLLGTPNRRIVKAAWLPKDSSNCGVACLDYLFYPIETTSIALTVTDSAGCIARDTITIWVQPNIYYPNAIYPESELQNYAFTVFSKEVLAIKELSIFNRWGERVFATQNTETNNLNQGWNGTYKGQRVSPDVFVFYAKVEILPNKIILIKGDITVF